MKLLMAIDRRTRYLDRAFPKSRDQILDEEIERELNRYPDGGKAVLEEFLSDYQVEVSNGVTPED